MTDKDSSTRKPLTTLEEVDALVLAEFPQPSGQCNFLCEELQNVADELGDSTLTAVQRKRLTARLAALGTQIRSLHCRCVLQ